MPIPHFDTSTTQYLEMNPPGERTAKRRKITLACNYCRSRKTRCDGAQPACSACENKGLAGSCLFEQGALRTQRYVSSLEARLEEYQRRTSITQTESITDASSTEAVAEPSTTASGRDKIRAAEQDAWSVGLQSPGLPTRSQRGATNGRSPRPDLFGTDAMVVVPSPEDGSEGTIGESSLMAFVRSMLKAAGSSNHSLRVGNASISSALPQAMPLPVPQDIDDEAMFLPPRRVADTFVASFWRCLHPIFPVLHKPTFDKSYNTLWETGNHIGPDTHEIPSAILLSTVNIVLAIGCQFSDQVVSTRKLTMADKLYQRSKRLFASELQDSPTLAVVQLLLLTGVYLQSTQYANRCWNSIGLAIRAAQSIGLHMDRRPDRRSQLQREMERRVWHTCVFLDRQLAITFGRPKMIWARSQVPSPAMIDDEFLLENGEGSQPPHLSPQMGTFIYSNSLFDILDDILVAFYMDKNQKPLQADKQAMSCDELSDVLRFNMELNKFNDTIPEWLSVNRPVGTTIDPKIELGAKILYSRLLYIRIFLLRPVLLFVAQQTPDVLSPLRHDHTRMEQRLASEASRLCVSTAQTLIAHIHENMNNFYWTSISHKLHYTFSCAVVFIAARLGPLEDLGTSRESLKASWDQCIELFEYYKPHLQSAAQVLQILEMLEGRLRETTGQDTTTAVGEDQNQVDPSALNLGRLEGLGLDANWAMLDDLLPPDWFGANMAGDFFPGDTCLDPSTDWDGLL